MTLKLITLGLRLAYRHLTFGQFLKFCKWAINYGIKGYKIKQNLQTIRHITDQQKLPVGKIVALVIMAAKIFLAKKSKA